MKFNSSVKNNAIYNTIKSISTLVFPLITFPYISRVLLADGVGKINFGNSIISYIGLVASLGISTYAIRECSKVRNDKKKLERIASEIYSINIVTTVIAYIILIFLLIFSKKIENYRTLIIIQSFSVAATTVGADWINNVMEDFAYITIRTFSSQLLSLVLMFIFVHKPSDYINYAIITLISSSGAQLLNAFYRKRFCNIKFIVYKDYMRHLKSILMLFSMQLAMIIYVNSDVTILGIECGNRQVGLYSVSVKIYNIIQTLVTSVQAVIIPKLAVDFSKKNFEGINYNLRYAYNFMTVLGLPCLVGVILTANGLVTIISGPGYIGCIQSMRILMIALLFSFIGGFINNLILLPNEQDKICLVSSCISATANLILNLILIPYGGINAAACTTAISMLLVSLIELPYVDRRVTFNYMLKDLRQPLLACLIMTIVGMIIATIFESIILRSVVQIVVCAITYFGILIILKNRFILEIFNSILGKFK